MLNNQFPGSVAKLPRVDLALLPTPLHKLSRFTEALGGPTIYIKRDDLTGLAGGGNKTRKLEFIVADALAQNADCLITAGGIQSNHCRQTAAAAARYCLDCHVVFGANPPSVVEGNYFIDQLLGAKFYWTEKRRRNEKMEEVAAALHEQGKRPYVIPVGGSNALGAIGYATTMFEIKDQLRAANINIDYLIFATSSGGTQAGLTVGGHLSKLGSKTIGVSIDQVPDDQSDFKYQAFVLGIANDAAQLLGMDYMFTHNDININYDYLGQGYGVVGDIEREAVRLLARTEGILVGPVYTGRALGALIDLIRKDIFRKEENVLFLHTGDDIALHAYRKDFEV